MSLTFTKAHVKRMAEVLDGEYEDVSEAAEAALGAALEIIAERAKFTVVGQLATSGGEQLAPSDPRAVKVALGWYATEKQAHDDAQRLYYSTQTNETARAWVLPIWNGTPASYYKDRKEAQAQLDMAGKSEREQILAERLAWFKNHPNAKGEEIPAEMRGLPWPDRHPDEEKIA